LGFDADHASSQKRSLRYLSALSQSTVTMVALSPRDARSLASRGSARLREICGMGRTDAMAVTLVRFIRQAPGCKMHVAASKEITWSIVASP
jgi:hypothetical protein